MSNRYQNRINSVYICKNMQVSFIFIRSMKSVSRVFNLQQKQEIVSSVKAFNTAVYGKSAAIKTNETLLHGISEYLHDNSTLPETALKANIALAFFPHNSFPKKTQTNSDSELLTRINIPNENSSLKFLFEYHTADQFLKQAPKVQNFTFHSENTKLTVPELTKNITSQQFPDGHFSINDLNKIPVTIGVDIKHGSVNKYGATGVLQELTYNPNVDVFEGVVNNTIEMSTLISMQIKFFSCIVPLENKFPLLETIQKKILKILHDPQFTGYEKQLLLQEKILEYHEIMPDYPLLPNLFILQKYKMPSEIIYKTSELDKIPNDCFSTQKKRTELITYIINNVESNPIKEQIIESKGTVWETSHIDIISTKLFL